MVRRLFIYDTYDFPVKYGISKLSIISGFCRGPVFTFNSEYNFQFYDRWPEIRYEVYRNNVRTITKTLGATAPCVDPGVLVRAPR